VAAPDEQQGAVANGDRTDGGNLRHRGSLMTPSDALAHLAQFILDAQGSLDDEHPRGPRSIV
jgi:hypothetical protein